MKDIAPSREASRPIAPILLLLFVVVAWGGNYTWVKMAIADGGAWTFNALRYVFAVLILGVVLAVRNGPGHVLPDRGERWPMALIGVLQIAFMTGGTTLALQYIEAGRTVLIAYSMPIWGMLLSFFILSERATLPTIVGLGVGLAGLGILCAPWSMDWSQGSAILGSAIAIVSTIGWALGSVLYRARRWRSDFWQQVFGQLLPSAIAASVAALIFETQTTRFTTPYTLILLYNAVIPSILGFWCWSQAIHRIPVATASQVLLLSPVFGIFLSSLVLGESITTTHVAAAGLIIAGAAVSYRHKRTVE